MRFSRNRSRGRRRCSSSTGSGGSTTDGRIYKVQMPATPTPCMSGYEFGRLFRNDHLRRVSRGRDGLYRLRRSGGRRTLEDEIQKDLDRRKPGQSMITTSRGEPDTVTINSGTQDGYTTGTPIGMVIENKDARSGKYEPYVTAPRPSHGDFTYSAKFGTRNWGGGGRSSARETVNWVAAGGVAKQVLEQSDYDGQIKAHVCQIGDVEAERSPSRICSNTARKTRFAVLTPRPPRRCATWPTSTAEGDSIGGAISSSVAASRPASATPVR